MTTTTRATKDALVLSGGGAKGAYEVGILKALAEGRSPATGGEPLEIEIFTGTSVGAYNAAFLVAQSGSSPAGSSPAGSSPAGSSPAGSSSAEAVARLEDTWRQRVANTAQSCGNGVFRLRDSPLNSFDAGCFEHPFEVLRQSSKDFAFWARYVADRGARFLAAPTREPLEIRFLESINLASCFDPEPLYRLIEDTIDRRQIGASDKKLTIAATDWHAGQVRLFSKAEIAGSIGLRAIAASAAIPGVFPPISIDGVPYQDGGVLLNTPLKPAIESGAEVIHAIFLDSQVIDVPLRVPPNTVDTVYRMFLIVSSALFRNDVARAIAIQRELELHRDLGIVSEDCRQVLADQGANSRVLRRFREGRPYRPLTIHCYRPKTDLGGGAGLLDFSAGFIDQLIAAGYEDAESHDCEAAGCVLAR